MLSWWATNISSKPVWGDGFVDDDVVDVFAAIDIEYASPEELFRYLPGLGRGDRDAVWQEVRRIFEARLEYTFPSEVGPAALLVEQGRAYVERLLAANDWREAQFREKDAVLVAFFTGVHPAFIWSEALISHDRFATFAWLGHVFRSQRAYLPREVAAYLLDVRADKVGTIACSDGILAELLPKAESKRLRRCAERCQRTSSAVFARRPRRAFALSLLRRRR